MTRSGQSGGGDRRDSRVKLDTPITYLKGVGPVRAQAMHRLGIVTAGDLLYHVPHRYEDASTVQAIRTLVPGMDATVIGTVISKGVIPTRKGLRIFQAVVRDATGIIEVSWPGQPYLDRSIQKDDTLLLSGPVRFFHGRQLQPREYLNLGSDADPTSAGRVLSVYPATEGLSFKVIRGVIDTNLDALLERVDEYLPPWILQKIQLVSLPDAFRAVHRPTSIAEAIRGRTRLAFEELLFLQLLQRRANQLAREWRAGVRFVNQRQFTTKLKETLPYSLTNAQARAIREIFGDMESARRMHRLLQGDVGSGKTIVALFAALLAMENGYQAVIMAPTELLAEQHYQNFLKLLEPVGITPYLLTGRLTSRERKAVAEVMTQPHPILVVGTHALVQESATFAKLGFVAIDEQHRFGVEQRKLVAQKGDAPDVLLMTATPIPRSLALTTYGDLDVSTLDERPSGRIPITTVLRGETGREKVYAFIRRQVEAGRQAYIVYPVIDESEKIDLKAATTEYEHLSSVIFPDRRIALLHGRLPQEERDTIMRSFRDGEVDVLVATTVIEVGIDVPNATVMLIEHPERFGLSQLHQLRGRVGRGANASYCILLGDVGQDSRDRLEIFVATDDGFEIAREDLRLRGMGDLFGEQQSGQAMFRIADPIRDEALNFEAREIAETVLSNDPELAAPEHSGIRQVLQSRYARAMELFRVG